MTQVPFIEYVNVRIKGSHARLFTRETYEDLMSGDNLGTITTYLLNHPRYGSDVSAALENHLERRGLEIAVLNNFARSVSDLHGMSCGKVRELFDLVLYSFEVRNIRTILLAHIRKTPANRVREMIVPVGVIAGVPLEKMLGTPDLTAMAILLKGRFPAVSESLKLALKTESDGGAVTFVNRVEQHLYRHVLAALEKTDDDSMHLRDVYRLEIDLRNITSALKQIWQGVKPGEKQFSSFIPGGSVRLTFLEQMTAVKSLDEAIEMVEQTPFHEAVEKGIIYYAETGFLHEMERFFEEVVIRKTQVFRRLHYLGVAVFLSYVWSHYVEMTNLRTIINGISFKTGAGQIRKGLIYV